MVTANQSNFWAALLAERKAGWDALRAQGPVVEINGVYHLTRRADVLAALNNPEVFSSARRKPGRAFETIALPNVPSWFDPPDHTRYRKILQPLFRPAVVNELMPTFTQQAATLINAVAGRGECDAMAAVAVPYPVDVFLTFCGLPAQDREQVIQLKNPILGATQADASYLSAVFELSAYLARAIGDRRRNGGQPGLLPQLQELTDAEAIGFGVLLVLGGINTVTEAIAFALLALACDPQMRSLLRTDPEQVKVFVDEVIRLEAPVPTIARMTTRDVTIDDLTIPAGSVVALRVGAVNREDSDDLTVADDQLARHRHWSFGAGPHRCLGSYLARMELTVVVNEWLRRIPDFGLEPGYSPAIHDIAFYPGGYTLGSLPLRWTATSTMSAMTV